MDSSNVFQKAITTEIIFQDMRYQQLISGLETLGLVNEHHLDLCTIAGRLQGIPKGEISDMWMKIYLKFVEDATDLPMDNKNELYDLAEKCYEHLTACYTIEKMVKE